MRPPAIVVFSGARIIIVLHYTSDGGGTIYIAQLSAVDKRARSGVGSVFHDLDIGNEGAWRSGRARTTGQARRPASVAAYRPASTFVNSPSAWSVWRWNESFEEESTNFFFRIAEYATGPETKTKPTTARRIGFARDSSIPWRTTDEAPGSGSRPTSEARVASDDRRTNVPPFAAHFPLMWRIQARRSSRPCTASIRSRSSAYTTGRSTPFRYPSIAVFRWYNCAGAKTCGGRPSCAMRRTSVAPDGGFARGPSTATRAARPAASETTSEIFGSLPTAPSSARAVLSSCTMWRVRRSASNSYGFSTKSIAPPFIASTAASIVPSPVIMTTAVSGLTTRRRCRTSSPVALGIRRYRRATSNDSR